MRFSKPFGEDILKGFRDLAKLNSENVELDWLPWLANPIPYED